MDFLISASTDAGTRKATNQDSLFVSRLLTCRGKMVFAVLCDGMGGMEKGELASATLVKAFCTWAKERLQTLQEREIADADIRAQWEDIIFRQNEKIIAYGVQNGILLGTTVTAMLLTEKRYYILNVGDSRAYEITDALAQLTQDQTVVAREVALGNLTSEEAEKDSRRNVLLQCVGIKEDVCPEMYFGDTKPDAVYMLCSDGFRHEISPQEFVAYYEPACMTGEDVLRAQSEHLIALNKQRNEKDNISVITVKVCC
ncbi:MAG: serine/threonine-protein phosphatase [Clostridiales Family XIII bacterium]|nr:serine/threonine-protein phosphatase [Clostridiales Family XIII bacterium]